MYKNFKIRNLLKDKFVKNVQIMWRKKGNREGI